MACNIDQANKDIDRLLKSSISEDIKQELRDIKKQLAKAKKLKLEENIKSYLNEDVRILDYEFVYSNDKQSIYIEIDNSSNDRIDSLRKKIEKDYKDYNIYITNEKVFSVQQVLEQYKKDENIEKENAKLLKYIQDNVKFEMNYSKQLAYDFFIGESIAGLYDWKENVVTIADFEGLKADKEIMKMLSIEQVNQDDSVKDIDTASTQINMIISEINKRNIKFTTKLHESVHAAVFNYMRSDKGKAYSDEMNKLYEIVKESAKANPDMFTANRSYWSKDVDEFLAEALSKPELIKDLMKIDVEGNLITGAEKSMFDKIIDMIVEALGLSKKEDKLNMHKYLLDSFKAAVEANRDGKEYMSDKAPEVEYQKDSKYPSTSKNKVLKKFDEIPNVKEQIKFYKDMERLRQITENGIKKFSEMYPSVKLNMKDVLEDENKVLILGRAIGSIIDINVSDIRADTIPHEYAHVYINFLKDTPEISNLLNKIEKNRKLSKEDAKELLARKIGEIYVDKQIKLQNKEVNIIENIWKFIIKTINRIINKKEADEIRDINIIASDFESGKNAEKLKINIEFESARNDIYNSTSKNQNKSAVNKIKDINKNEDYNYIHLPFDSSPELSKYGTIDDYKEYVKTIFPNSKIKDILAHDTGSMWKGKIQFTESWMYTDDVEITGKGENYGLVSGEGFYMYNPKNINGEVWDEYSASTGYMIVDMKNPLYSDSKEYISIEGNDYYSKMSNLTNTPTQSNPDGWYMLDNPPEKVTINSIVGKKTGYDGFVNEVRKGLIEYVGWTADQVHILGSKKDIDGFKKYSIENNLKSSGLSLSDNNTVLLPISKPEIANEINGEINGFQLKKEFHITLLGFPQGKYLAKEIEKMDHLEFARDDINKALSKIDVNYELKNEFYQVERDREAFIDYKNPDLGKTIIHEESLIQLVDAPGLIEGIKKINKDFGVNLPIPFPHVTFATKGGLGIGISSKEEFDKLTTSKIEFEYEENQLEPEVDDNNKYKTISKDDIEAAKDIMLKNKEECR